MLASLCISTCLRFHYFASLGIIYSIWQFRFAITFSFLVCDNWLLSFGMLLRAAFDETSWLSFDISNVKDVVADCYCSFGCSCLIGRVFPF